MIKTMLLIGAMILSVSMVETVYAGDLNEYEQEILEAAIETYEYNGENYRVSQKYLEQLEEYLMEDHIDISSEDKELILQMAYNNIELGVTDGYLLPIEYFDIQEEQTQTNTKVKVNEEETIQELLESVSKDISDIEGYLPSSRDNTNDNKSTGDEIIKQTGFNLNNTLYVIIGIGILMIFGIISAVKNNYFSNNAYE